jgi:hypothetical protein
MYSRSRRRAWPAVDSEPILEPGSDPLKFNSSLRTAEARALHRLPRVRSPRSSRRRSRRTEIPARRDDLREPVRTPDPPRRSTGRRSSTRSRT